ncbi:isochorismatase family protein [Aquimarina sp. 2201CG5-10]|uniref:isochorismatase family protein n=1 Tax=Aquimarina callyspongiae TaxID=3098150 RepID=UPI002AB4CC44|nr:isochorismatase family protein [Aquimarina sp. 2201CG5-10]MDY8137920.1 isochorismatase family protein [Aquimarina sp. 2201CG5-10]
MKHKKALLVIDMQKGSFTPDTPRFDTLGVVNRINTLATVFRDHKFSVIFIQHDGTTANEFIPNTSEWELLDELEAKSSDVYINKYANDVFYKSFLASTLDNLEINELYITGCATDFCVESTIQSALTKDYYITVVEDGHTTGDRPHLKAEKVIQHYNWVWQNMIPTQGKIEVKSFELIKNSILMDKNLK